MMAQAEELRESFLSDTLGATAVFCLPRAGVNTYKPHTISYNPVQHGELDTPQKFRDHLYQILGRPATFPYRDYRNPLNTTATTPSENASICILGFSKVENKLKVLALYDLDVIRYTASNEPQGFYASVKRYTDNPLGTTLPLAFSGGYEVFYPPSIPAVGFRWVHPALHHLRACHTSGLGGEHGDRPLQARCRATLLLHLVA
jgi:hypothetical protein